MATINKVGIFVWVDDYPVTGNVLNLKNIVEPRKPIEEYQELEEVKAKCPGFGVQNAIIGKIADETEKKDLDGILAGNEFQNLVTRVWQRSLDETTTIAPEKRKRKLVENKEETDGEETTDEYHPQKKKKSKPSSCINPEPEEREAKEAKQEAARNKRAKEKAMAEASAEMSLLVLPGQSSASTSNKQTIETKIDELIETVKVVNDNQNRLIDLIEPLLEAYQCKECLKTMYKSSKKSQTIPSNRTPAKFPPKPSTFTPKPSTSQDDGKCDEGEAESEEVQPSQDAKNDSDLVYLGESLFGVKMTRKDLSSCMELSTKPEKLALNLLEFLLTAEECKNLTVYGYGKKNNSMDKNVRKAIKSQIFSHYMKDESIDAKFNFWNDVIVPKMNDKIRGIRNGKYKSKKI